MLSRWVALGILGTALAALAGCAQQTQTPTNSPPSHVTTRQRAALTGDTTPATAQNSKNDLHKILADQIRKAAAEKGTTSQKEHTTTRNQQTTPTANTTVSTPTPKNTTHTGATSKNNKKTPSAKYRPADHLVSSGRTHTAAGTPAGTPRRD